MRFVQVMFGNKDFLGETNNTHKDDFIVLHHPAALVGGGTAIVAFEVLPDIVPGPLFFHQSSCVIIEIRREGATWEKYQIALKSLPPANDHLILKPKLVMRPN